MANNKELDLCECGQGAQEGFLEEGTFKLRPSLLAIASGPCSKQMNKWFI